MINCDGHKSIRFIGMLVVAHWPIDPVQIKKQFLARFARAPPAGNTLRAWERKLFRAGAVHDAPRPGRPARRSLCYHTIIR